MVISHWYTSWRNSTNTLDFVLSSSLCLAFASCTDLLYRAFLHTNMIVVLVSEQLVLSILCIHVINAHCSNFFIILYIAFAFAPSVVTKLHYKNVVSAKHSLYVSVYLGLHSWKMPHQNMFTVVSPLVSHFAKIASTGHMQSCSSILEKCLFTLL